MSKEFNKFERKEKLIIICDNRIEKEK